MSLKAAFNLALTLAPKRLVTLERPGVYSVKVNISPGNYARKMMGIGDTIIDGREFVISKEALQLVSAPTIKRGDRITDEEVGLLTIDDVREMHDLTGEIIGYRVRTN
jgi:hypothetical protein